MQVSRANKNMEVILKQGEAKLNPNHKRNIEFKDGAIKDALYFWFVKSRENAVPLSGPVLIENAKLLAEKPW